ncbi:Hsp33 family molecular chaperone HslO [Ideonella livida]|uniref:Hsp33 family molecular chaperone HslO n=1 Tax=Ideonella livida TaxID=2707176 RepID=A0A7C9TJS8_9BURK|nr:Hsp33 family molecular chaperone HslO [Ideonella livida]NDY90825.1 Hsp33 family molecular chaperone HslO [Ideonella livida]
MSELHKFLFDGLPVRGVLVRLTSDWQELLARRQGEQAFDPAVNQLLGQMAAAVTMMQASIKFKGAVVLQMMGDGPVRLAVAEARSDLSFRATAKVSAPVTGPALDQLLNVRGQGRCALTLDPEDRQPGQQPYQGVVPLAGEDGLALTSVAQALEAYMRRSEQLDTRLVLAANAEVAAGLLIQRVPGEGVGNLGPQAQADGMGQSEDFNRIAMLAGSLTEQELLTLDTQTLLRRLFWEETVSVFEPQTPRFACSCSRERVASMLRSLGREEVESVLAEQGQIDVGCEHCGQHHLFDAVDAAALFAAPGWDGSTGPGRH